MKHHNIETETLHELILSIPDNLSVYEWFLYILRILDKIWHYPIISGDNQTIALSNLVVASVLMIVALKISKSLSKQINRRLLNKMDIEKNVAQAIEKVSYYTLVTIFTFVMLDIANIPLTAFTFVGGALAIGLGFGTQQILSNFVSGLILILEQPVRMGDIIEVVGSGTNLSGIVTNIGARCTHIVTTDNIDVIVPNSTLLQNTIINYTLSGGGKIRHSFDFKVYQENDIDKIFEILENIVYNQNDVLQFPEPTVMLSNLSDRLFNFKISFWIDLRADISRSAIISNVYYDIFNELKKNNIEINPPVVPYA